MKNRFIWTLFASLLVACGDDALINQSEATLSQHVYVLPPGTSLNSDRLSYYAVGDTLYVEPNQTYKFYAIHSLDGESVTETSSLYASLLWELDGQYYNIESFQHSFSTSGAKKGFLETVDLYGDTVRKNFDILVNTPNQIELVSPANGYNQVERDNDLGLPLRWKIEGLDPWETASCTVYASDSKDDVWTSSLGTVDCNTNINLRGVVDEEMLSNTVYWAVSMLVDNGSKKSHSAYTHIFSFSTKTAEQSLLNIPINYRSLPQYHEVNTEIILTNAAGDTLQVTQHHKDGDTIQISVEAQTGVHIYARDQLRTEYESQSQVIDIPERTSIQAATINFTDKTPPQVAPVRRVFSPADSLIFDISDLGSGVNASTIKVFSGADTLSFDYVSSTLAIASPCKYSCSIIIEGEDYANNPFPHSYWNVENMENSTIISGPYPREDF